MRITKHFKTMATIGFTGPVTNRPERINPLAHHAVCHLQVRRGKGELLGRRVNSCGKYTEVGESFVLTDDLLEIWEQLANGDHN